MHVSKNVINMIILIMFTKESHVNKYYYISFAYFIWLQAINIFVYKTYKLGE